MKEPCPIRRDAVWTPLAEVSRQHASLVVLWSAPCARMNGLQARFAPNRHAHRCAQSAASSVVMLPSDPRATLWSEPVSLVSKIGNVRHSKLPCVAVLAMLPLACDTGEPARDEWPQI